MNLKTLSFAEVASAVEQNPTVVIPLGGLEPIGGFPLGFPSDVVGRIATAVAQRQQSLCAPVIEYGFATPFKAFDGVLGMRRSTIENALADIFRAAQGWGVTRIIVVDGGLTGEQLVANAVKRFQTKLSAELIIETVCWQNLGAVRKFVKGCGHALEERWRSEAALCLGR